MDDLISRSALKDSFCEACSTNKRYHLTNEECRSKTNALYGYGCFKVRLIDNAPAVDAEPVRRGEWIPKTYSISVCSVCEQPHFAHVESWNYCPNCGAKMDAEVQDRKKEEKG